LRGRLSLLLLDRLVKRISLTYSLKLLALMVGRPVWAPKISGGTLIERVDERRKKKPAAKSRPNDESPTGTYG